MGLQFGQESLVSTDYYLEMRSEFLSEVGIGFCASLSHSPGGILDWFLE